MRTMWVCIIFYTHIYTYLKKKNLSYPSKKLSANNLFSERVLNWSVHENFKLSFLQEFNSL